VAERGGEAGWVQRGTSLSYVVLTALADRFPKEAGRWIDVLRERNDRQEMPESHDGGKAFCWTLSALWLDACPRRARAPQKRVRRSPLTADILNTT